MILEQFLTNQLFVFSIAKLASVTRITPEYGKNNSNSFDANRIAMNLETSEFFITIFTLFYGNWGNDPNSGW